MDRALNALVNLDVPADIVCIDVQGSLNQDSRPGLVQIIRRIRRMGIRSHIRVELSSATLVESSALAGLRSDLNAIDTGSLTGISGAGVSLDLSPAGNEWAAASGSAGQPLTILDGFPVGAVADISALGYPAAAPGEAGIPPLDLTGLEVLCGRTLQEYSDEELLLASDTLFTLLDNPAAFPGSDLLARYDDIGQEMLRRQQDTAAPIPAAEGQAAS
ncbi:hypothetical protein [Arthrobacter sp. Alg241-R88]|uniref:hypothetical protein n=1 Tax=Arthrobacter sp. Alg241-R88 TaxID=2305984 RepID=UPI0013D57689|nr:hypothetical protein [Arthrobacter sp. Alg241-R88]